MPAPAVLLIRTIDELFDVLASGATMSDGPNAAGERVDQLAHGLQCAHELARVRPHDHGLQVAGLFHDIGHLLVPGDDAWHGTHGHSAVRALLGARVARLIELHVPAKRYLVSTDPGYRELLSSVSTHTLVAQGGAMSADELVTFEQCPAAADAVLLRRADDAAKVPGRPVPDLDTWRPVVTALAGRLPR